MAREGKPFASAGRNDELRPPTPAESRELAEHRRVVDALISAGRIDEAPVSRLQVVGGQILNGAEHAFGDSSTLCGISESEVFLMRHLFRPDGRFACPTCAPAARNDRGSSSGS